jgi:hypothetical protein
MPGVFAYLFVSAFLAPAMVEARGGRNGPLDAILLTLILVVLAGALVVAALLVMVQLWFALYGWFCRMRVILSPNLVGVPLAMRRDFVTAIDGTSLSREWAWIAGASADQSSALISQAARAGLLRIDGLREARRNQSAYRGLWGRGRRRGRTRIARIWRRRADHMRRVATETGDPILIDIADGYENLAAKLEGEPACHVVKAAS